jgi:DNA-nicking Smr family endonuclease
MSSYQYPIGRGAFGFGYDVKCMPDGLSGDRTAAVQFINEVTKPRFPDLFPEITKRHTNRKKYEERAIDGESLQRLKDCVNKDGFRLDIITDIEAKKEMADLLAKAQKNPARKQSLPKGAGIMGETKQL